ncbi:hypothetical protein [Bradyrhizobium brasilense]|uniref:hypothetical protein n=1 Tax=Bradyrhizobium brasilense TaxID=1419277 RepID=UPI001178900A|nr:hypothetical protein [Bradyrhizobium brasilense]
MLQFPVVEPECGAKDKPTGHFLVNAGEGRCLAQLLRAKRKEIKKDEQAAIPAADASLRPSGTTDKHASSTAALMAAIDDILECCRTLTCQAPPRTARNRE